MKITQEHYAVIKEAVEKNLKKKNTTATNLVKYYKTFDLGKNPVRRAIWDVFHSSFKQPELSEFVCGTLYNYVNDDHIETALKQVFRELGAEV
jgi:hypothetical protein